MGVYRRYGDSETDAAAKTKSNCHTECQKPVPTVRCGSDEETCCLVLI